MVNTHKYNTRNKNRKLPVENIYLITSESPKKKSPKKTLKHSYVKEQKISNNDDNQDDSSDDEEDIDDTSSIDDEMKDFIVKDSESIQYSSSNDEHTSDSEISIGSDSSDCESISESYYSNNKKSKKFNKYEYAKFLNKIFPSTYSRDKINQIKRRRLLSPKSSSNNFNHIICLDTSMINSKRKSYTDSDSESDSESESGSESRDDIINRDKLLEVMSNGDNDSESNCNSDDEYVKKSKDETTRKKKNKEKFEEEKKKRQEKKMINKNYINIKRYSI